MQFLDVLRGFALFGVLVANLVWYECDMVLTRAAAAALPTSTIDTYAKTLVVFFVNGKFITIFSFLFAVGFTLQTRRATDRCSSAFRVYGRRIAVLFVLGCLHMALLWFGDILLMYSLMGGLLLAVRRWQPGRAMVTVAAVLILLSHFTFEVVHHVTASPPSAHSAAPPDGLPQERIAAAFRAEYPSVVRKNVRLAAGDLVGAGVILFLLPEIFGRFLLGFYAGRRGWLFEIDSHRAILWRALPWLLLVGVIGNGVAVAREWSESAAGTADQPLWLLATPVSQLGIVSMAAFYAACVALLMERERSGRLLAHLAPVGRMALTNYLTHSVAFLLIMTGVGLGAAGRFGAAVCLAISIVLFACQIVMSAWWLRRFRFGPVEWLWRSLTYGRAQTMRVEPAAAQART